MMNKVLVLLSAYNGERFIREQLQSLVSQEGVDVHVLIRDDGSMDDTGRIIDSFAKEHDNVSYIRGNNIGCVHSFVKLAKMAYEEYQGFDYFAFCDQDDVWQSRKLFRACSLLDNCMTKQETPYKLYGSAYQMVDECLNPIPTSMVPSLLTFGESLVIQPTIGCTYVFNRSMLRLFIKGDPKVMLMHDSWMYKVCLGCGGKYIGDTESYILYRQHTHNVKGGGQSFSQRWCQRWDNFRHNRKSRTIQAESILKTYEEDLTDENRQILEDFVGMTSSLMQRIKVLCSKRYNTVNFTHNLLFRIAVLFNKV